MVYLLGTIHVLLCFFLIIVVLLQSGKAADLAGAFGGMGSQTVFGPRGTATVLSKATTIAASLFMLTSLALAIMSSRSAPASSSVLQNRRAPIVQPHTTPNRAPAAQPQPKK
jgi:preprotein translocase subunit SecG